MELHDPAVLIDPLYLSQQQWKSRRASFYYCSNALSSKRLVQILAFFRIAISQVSMSSLMKCSLSLGASFFGSQKIGAFSPQLWPTVMDCDLQNSWAAATGTMKSNMVAAVNYSSVSPLLKHWFCVDQWIILHVEMIQENQSREAQCKELRTDSETAGVKPARHRCLAHYCNRHI